MNIIFVIFVVIYLAAAGGDRLDLATAYHRHEDAPAHAPADHSGARPPSPATVHRHSTHGPSNA